MTRSVRAPRRVKTRTDALTWTPTRTFEYIQDRLGVGNFAGESVEFFPWKMKEIGILKRIMMHRRITPQQVVACVDYCKAHRIQPETAAGMFFYIEEALKWDKKREKNQVQLDLEKALDMEQERALSDHVAKRWIDRLLRATGPQREVVLAEWQKERS